MQPYDFAKIIFLGTSSITAGMAAHSVLVLISVAFGLLTITLVIEKGQLQRS
jgi:hypothetical protein